MHGYKFSILLLFIISGCATSGDLRNVESRLDRKMIKFERAVNLNQEKLVQNDNVIHNNLKRIENKINSIEQELLYLKKQKGMKVKKQGGVTVNLK